MTARLQLALDEGLQSSLSVLHQVGDLIDIVEVGTLLVLREGLRSVGLARALAPGAPILADVRVAEAGNSIAELVFDSGADWVSVVSGASMATVAEVCRSARRHGGEVQIELGLRGSPGELAEWADAGVTHVILHRSRDAAQDTWAPQQVERIEELSDAGFVVTVTGGVSVPDAQQLSRTAADIIIVGRGITQAADPRAAALEYRSAISDGG